MCWHILQKVGRDLIQLVFNKKPPGMSGIVIGKKKNGTERDGNGIERDGEKL